MKQPLAFLFACFIHISISSQNCNNEDFEATATGSHSLANSVNGWTISSQTYTGCGFPSTWLPGSSEFSVISTPVLGAPNIGNLPNSPLGGSKVAVLNDLTANSSVTRLTKLFTITSPTQALLSFAFAGSWQNGSHNCCEQSAFKVQLRDCNGNLVTCPNYTLAGFGCDYVPSYTVSSGISWTSWQVKYFDLSQFLNSCVTLEVMVKDCAHGDHYGSVYFDASCPAPMIAPCNCMMPMIHTPPLFCQGTSSATIQGPMGFTEYQWAAPAGFPLAPSQSTLSTISITNAVAGNVYSLSVMNPGSFCGYTTTYTLVHNPVNVVAIGASTTCVGGASGSASVAASGGNGSGYVYTWLSTHSVVGTGTTVSNLTQGTYTVNVTSATSSLSCGSASAMITVNTGTHGVINALKPFCGANFILCSPQGGSNFQWYAGSSAITPSLGGTASCYTISNPVHSGVYHLKYLSAQGCNDSLKFTLVQTPPGTLSTVSNSTVCAGASNGVTVFSINPSTFAGSQGAFFLVTSTGNTPAYSSSLVIPGAYTFTATGLTGGGTYSLIATDGLCQYSLNLSVNSLPSFNYNVFPNNTPTLCPGNSINAGVNFPNPPGQGQYTYSWTASSFLVGNNLPNAIITPSAAVGSYSNLVFAVTVTSTLTNCSVTKTLAIVAANPAPPAIFPIGQICDNGNPQPILTNPFIGVSFSGNNAVTANGLLTPSLASAGAHTFLCTNSSGTCTASNTGSFVIVASPTISITGSNTLCSGSSATFVATGQSLISWSNGWATPTLVISPSTNTYYIAAGIDMSTNCQGFDTIQVSVLPPPVVTVSGNFSICAGNTSTLSASGANTYTWSNAMSGANVSVSPVTSTVYTVTATGANLCIGSKTVSVFVDACTGIEEGSKGNEFLIHVFPNPTSGRLIIETEIGTQVVVMDGSGRLVYARTLDANVSELNLSELATGFYQIKAANGKKQHIIRLVIE